MTISKQDIPTETIVKIEKLSNLGLGIAKIDGYVVFVEGACPEDIVKIRLEKKNKNFAKAKILEIIEPSKHRVQPFCPMQSVCGACQLQFIDYNYQLELKQDIVKDAIKSICGENIEVKQTVQSPKTKEYRHKIQYPISETKESGRILAGYYKPSSHELVNIKYCPIQPNYCDTIINFIRNTAKECGIKGYVEKQNKGDLKHVVIRTSEFSKKNLVALVINSTKMFNNIKILAKRIYEELENIDGVLINYNPQKTNLILGEKNELIYGKSYIEEKLCDKIFQIGTETFFQVNPYTANNIFNYVKQHITENFNNPSVLDAYAGITTFGICVSDIAKKVVSVEENKASVDMAKKIIKQNNIKNIEIHNMDAGEFFEKELNTKKQFFDVTILDPPRKGCIKESLDYALKLTKKQIIYVSCNPATLARDLKYLIENGCKVQFIQPFDMFPHTYHVESVAIINVN